MVTDEIFWENVLSARHKGLSVYDGQHTDLYFVCAHWTHSRMLLRVLGKTYRNINGLVCWSETDSKVWSAKRRPLSETNVTCLSGVSLRKIEIKNGWCTGDIQKLRSETNVTCLSGEGPSLVDHLTSLSVCRQYTNPSLFVQTSEYCYGFSVKRRLCRRKEGFSISEYLYWNENYSTQWSIWGQGATQDRGVIPR